MSGSNNEVLMYAIVLGAIFFLFILPKIEKKYNQEQQEMIEKMSSLIEEKRNSILKMDTKKCSKECCLHTQWPAPHMPEKKSDKYIGTNFMCNNGNGGGCLCVTKQDKEYLSKRGLNYETCE